MIIWIIKENVKPPKIQKMDPKSKITRKRGKKGTRKKHQKKALL